MMRMFLNNDETGYEIGGYNRMITLTPELKQTILIHFKTNLDLDEFVEDYTGVTITALRIENTNGTVYRRTLNSISTIINENINEDSRAISLSIT